MNLPFKKHVLICIGPRCGNERNSSRVRQEFRKEFVRQGLLTGVKETPCVCFGLCSQGPNVIIYPEGVVYAGVKPQDVAQIVREHLVGGKVVERLLLPPKDDAAGEVDPPAPASGGGTEG